MAAPVRPLIHLDEIWKANPRDLLEDGSLGGWSVTAVCEKHLEWQLAEHHRLLEEQRLSFQRHWAPQELHGARNVPTLASLSAAKIIDLLAESDNVVTDVRTVAKHLSTTTLQNIVRDGRTPYVALRSFMRLPPGYGPSDAGETARAAVDIDEAVLVNERYIRSKVAVTGGDRDLLRLDQADLLFDASQLEKREARLVITRKTPPKGGLEIFDALRPRELAIQRNTQTFISTFNRITRNIFRGLDWKNVFIAGGMVLTALLQVDPSTDGKRIVQDSDVDVYLYDLSPEAANRKVKEIYQLWSSNLPADNRQRLVVKNAKTITFLADYPNRRIQIVLKLVPSPISVLLNFDLDPCAIGFDGKDVLMLPRCARALETGYTTFTMDLIWGHHLQDRRATQDLRVMKYADRGFGVRILPSHVRSLEEVTLHVTQEKYPRPNLYARKPSGAEPGLKTLKRSALMASDFIHRYLFGVTDLVEKDSFEDEDDFLDMVEEQKEENRRVAEANAEARARGEPEAVPLIDLAQIDTYKLHRGLPGKWKGVGSFEVWMRHHEAWRLDAVGEAA